MIFTYEVTELRIAFENHPLLEIRLPKLEAESPFNGCPAALAELRGVHDGVETGRAVD